MGSQGCPNTNDPGGDNILLSILYRNATIDKIKFGNRDRLLITKLLTSASWIHHSKPLSHSESCSKGNFLNLFLATKSLVRMTLIRGVGGKSLPPTILNESGGAGLAAAGQIGHDAGGDGGQGVGGWLGDGDGLEGEE
jgi:hypothetical protein